MCDQGSLVGLCMQDYKSLCAAVTICASLVDAELDLYMFLARSLGRVSLFVLRGLSSFVAIRNIDFLRTNTIQSIV